MNDAHYSHTLTLLNSLNISLSYADLLDILENTHYSHILTLLNSLNINLSLDNLLSIFEKTDYNHTLMIYISKSRGVNGWDRLIFLLRVFRFLMLKDGTGLEIMGNGLLRFSYYNRPSVTQIEQIKAEYSQCKPFLSEERQKALEFQMFPMIKILPNS